MKFSVGCLVLSWLSSWLCQDILWLLIRYFLTKTVLSLRQLRTHNNHLSPNFNSVWQTIPEMVFLRALILFLVLQDCTEIGFTAPSGLLKSLLTNLISEDNSLLTNLIEEDNPMKLFGSLGTNRKLSMTLLLIENSKSWKKMGTKYFQSWTWIYRPVHLFLDLGSLHLIQSL